MAWLGTWKKRRKITVDKTKIDAALTAFPVLLKLGESVGLGSKDVRSIFTEVGASSKKIAITKTDGTTEIYAEIERWDNTNKLAEIWVSKSDLSIASDADTDLYIYYDSTKDDNTDYIGETQSTPAKLVWDSNFKFRSDMKDKTTSTIEDSTSNANHGDKLAANRPIQADGKIAKAQKTTAANDVISVGDDASIAELFKGGGSVSFWVRLDSYEGKSGSTSGYARMLDQHKLVSSVSYGWEFVVTNVANNNLWFRHRFSTTAGAWGLDDDDGNVFGEEAIFHVVLTYNSDSTANVPKIYTNGVERSWDSTTNPAGSARHSELLRIFNEEGGIRTLDGWMDEVQVSSVIRPAAWIKAEYNAGNDSLITWGDEESATPTEKVGPFPTFFRQ